MIGQILNAFEKELKELYKDTGTMVIRDLQSKSQNDIPLYTTNLVEICLNTSPEVQQLPGGAKQAEWIFALNIYFWDVNAGLNEDDGFSSDKYNEIDFLTNHFIKQVWLTNDFQSIVDTYSYKLTLKSIAECEPIESSNGLIKGYSILLDTIGIDTSTMSTAFGAPLEQVQQLGETDIPYFIETNESTLTFLKAGETKTLIVETNVPFIVETNVSWLTVTPIVSNNTTELTITAIENTANIGRLTTIEIKPQLVELNDLNIIINQL